MSQIIKLSISKIKGEVPASAVSYGFDIDDIVIPITFNSATGKSTLEARQIKGGQPDGRNTAKVEYEVNHTLSAIAAMSEKLFVGTVLNKRNIVNSGQRVFNSKRISENLVPTANGTKFFYCEDGDPNGVEYEVSEDIDNIIGQLTATAIAIINARNGLNISGGYVELGGPLIHTTDIGLGQYELTMSSSYLGYTTIFGKAYNGEYLSIDDGVADYIGEVTGPNATTGTFGFFRQVVNSVTPINFFEILTASEGYALYESVGFTANLLYRVNPGNSNGAGIIETPPTYAYTPTENSVDRLIAIASTGELYNTDILPSDIKLEFLQKDVSDETTALTSGAAKMTFRMPYAMELSEVRASLSTAQAADGGGGIFTVDLNESGNPILSTGLTIDNTQKTSTTATTPAVISNPSLADDAEITVDISQIGDGTAKGLKITLIGKRV